MACLGVMTVCARPCVAAHERHGAAQVIDRPGGKFNSASISGQPAAVTEVVSALLLLLSGHFSCAVNSLLFGYGLSCAKTVHIQKAILHSRTVFWM